MLEEIEAVFDRVERRLRSGEFRKILLELAKVKNNLSSAYCWQA